MMEIATDKVIGHYRRLASRTENPEGRHRWGPKLKATKDRLGPMLLLCGTPDQVCNAAWRALNTLAPCGGLVLSEGDNVAPGTPVANMQAMVQAAEDYGVPDARSTLH